MTCAYRNLIILVGREQLNHLLLNKILNFCFILFFTLSAITCEKQAEYQAFYSWYNGWGTHTIWGLGKINASYSGAIVICGNIKIDVITIYDTHADHEKPKPHQSSEHAERHNLKLIQDLKKQGIDCTLKDRQLQ